MIYPRGIHFSYQLIKKFTEMKNLVRKTMMKLLPFLIVVLFIASFIGCDKNNDPQTDPTTPADTQSYTVVNMVASDASITATRIDAKLVNAWGISFSPTGTPWISSTGDHSTAIYNGLTGAQQLAAVNIPTHGAATGGMPTGQVNNPTGAFPLANGNGARFIFAGLDGIISGWNGGTGATAMVDRNGTSVYTGLAIGNVATDSFLYATDFKSGKVDKFNRTWVLQTASFVDPNLPAGYAPFNAQNIGGLIYVTYAQKDGTGEEKKGVGLGAVSVFNPDGSFVKRFVTGGKLNAPWGVAQAPAGWLKGAASSTVIVVGNFGDGHINAYDAANGTWLGTLKTNGTVITIDGLWGISFKPSGATALNGDWLYFAAGPADETKGVFGYVTK
jgi:uncharacterized protein (TIGR03118 family)